MADTDVIEWILLDTDLVTRLAILPVISSHLYIELSEPGSGSLEIPLDTTAAGRVANGQFCQLWYRGAARGGFFIDNIKITDASAGEGSGRVLSVSGRGSACRMIVSEVPGTTRDSVDAMLTWHRKQFRIVETAGIRRAGRVARGGQVETLSVMLARRAIERCDVVVLVIDATEGPTDQDGTIVGAAVDAGRGLVIAANKWDLMKGEGQDGAKHFDENLRHQLKFLDFVPILHISAKTGERAPKLLDTIEKVSAARNTRVPTGELNRFIEAITTAHPPVSPGRRNVRVLYAAQTGVAPPSFVLFTNVATKLHFSYERFLENRLRAEYGFFGTPIRITVRRRAEHRGRGEKPGA